jgi:outer membrane protein assembly factor BamA
MNRLIVILLFLFVADHAAAQAVLRFAETSGRTENNLLKRLSAGMPIPSDSLKYAAALRGRQEQLMAAGYLEASVDSTTRQDSLYTTWWHIGAIYKWGELRTDAEQEPLLAEAGVRDKLYRSRPMTPAAIAEVHRKVLTWCENNGYPFAEVRFDSVTVTDSRMSALYLVDRGPLILFDTAEVKGSAKLSKAYLFNYLNLRPGTPYSQVSVRKIRVRLKELPFVTEARPFELGFTDSTARPVFFLQQKKASQFNGVIGVLPNNEESGKVYVTGDLRLRLHNVFGHAELLDFNWSNPQPRSQDLRVKFSYPFLFDMPFGVDADLTLFKKDTIFLEFFRQLGLRYYLHGNSSVRVFAGIRSSNLISTVGYENITTLPEYADVRTEQYGLGAMLERIDYRLNPRRGFVVDVAASAGGREITKNAKVNQEVYEGVDLNTTQYRGEIVGDVYFPLGGRGVINLNMLGGLLESPDLFRNELFRLGGLRTLRGFDEQSILASRYIGGRLETRFILDQNSYLLAFYNQAYIEDRSEGLTSDDPFGFGAGLTFNSRIGIFSFIYALGSRLGNPVEFRSGKIHFGILNTF